ncbi:MAG TPA: T9SS type A sorting domain-containing protein, partial [Ferruginibacter sp.]|nr:T9SS type A sorting domain-containing protein [Ferruginibacter sp.]
STDGINFSAIGTIAARGDATTGSNYTFNDNSPGQGINFYRLKMLDIDGRFTYSWIAIVQFSDKDQQQVKIFPNPASDNLYIDFGTTAAETYSCVMADAAGKIVWAAGINTATRNTFSINVSSLAEGIYFISVKNERAAYRQKVIVKH